MCVKRCTSGSPAECNSEHYESSGFFVHDAFGNGNCTQPFDLSETSWFTSSKGLGFNKAYP